MTTSIRPARFFRLGALLSVATGAFATACASMDGSAFESGDPSTQDGGGGSMSPGSDAGAAIQASGVILAHAAAYPQFRLCFENLPSLKPQPDSRLMPNANVVGVEVGSVVRLDPLPAAPGKVYVIDRRTIDDERSCGSLIGNGTGAGTELRPNLDYVVADAIAIPLGVAKVDILAITGCGPSPYLLNLGIDSSECGPEWQDGGAASGALRARVVTVSAATRPGPSALPVQLLHLSSDAERLRGTGDRLDVTFRALDGDGGAQAVASSPKLFEQSQPVSLDITHADDTFYASHGFQIDIGDDAGAPAFRITQSLASVQDLSDSRSIPSTYFESASNYALLLLGDPRNPRGMLDSGVDRRRALHLVAIPVREPDAGADASTEAGPDSSTDDGG